MRALEERGIGRPSTYAAIIGTILDRGYVFKRGTALVPSFLAFAVVELLEQHFSRLVDYEFTARMEDDLDRIAAGDEERVDWLRRVLLRRRRRRGGPEAARQRARRDRRARVNTFPIPASDIVLRVGRYGPYVERGEDRASVPPELAPDELTVEKAEELLAQPSGERELGVDPETGRTIMVKSGRFGPYVTEVLEEGAKEKPRTASLFKSMSPDTIDLEQALRLLSLPRVVGADPADGEDVQALNGRYGPYIKKGTETRSLEEEDQIFTITLEEALERLAKPKERRRRGGGTAAQGARAGPGDPEADRRQDRPLRRLRHRRRDEREPARGRRRRDDHSRTRRRAPRRPARARDDEAAPRPAPAARAKRS